MGSFRQRFDAVLQNAVAVKLVERGFQPSQADALEFLRVLRRESLWRAFRSLRGLKGQS